MERTVAMVDPDPLVEVAKLAALVAPVNEENLVEMESLDVLGD